MSQIEILCRVQALYSFSSNDPSSLSFEQNDYIDVLNKLPSGWWDGLCNGARGWFPSNYVRVICDEKSCFQEQLVLDYTGQFNTVDSDYRLSLAYNSRLREQPTHNMLNNSLHSKIPWGLQQTEDESDTYSMIQYPRQRKYINTAIGNSNISTLSKKPFSSSETDLHFLDNSLDVSKPEYLADEHVSADFSANSSILFSNNERPEWINSATPRSKSRLRSMDNSMNTSQFSLTEPDDVSAQPLPKSPARTPSIRRKQLDEPLTWNKVSINIAIAIHQLISAAKSGHYQLYNSSSKEIISSIRHMLMASSNIDKEVGYMKSNSILRTHHRAMMASMSKLVLTTRISTFTFLTEEEQRVNVNKILSEASELLLSARNFVNTCQSLSIPLIETDPQFIMEADAHRDDNENKTPFITPLTDRKFSTTDDNSSQYSLQLNLVESLETIGNRIQDSVETIIRTINNCVLPTSRKNISNNNKQDRISLIASLFTHFRNLSSQTSLFIGYLTEMNFSPVQNQKGTVHIEKGKQELTKYLGLLFFYLQALTADNTLNDSHEEHLNNIRTAAHRLIDPITLICESVLVQAAKVYGRQNSDASLNLPLDKSQSIRKKASTSFVMDMIIEDANEITYSNAEENDPSIINVIEEEEEEESDQKLSVSSIEQCRSGQSSSQASSITSLSLQKSLSNKSTAAAKKVKRFFSDDYSVSEKSSLNQSITATESDSSTIINYTPPNTADENNQRPFYLRYDYGLDDIVFNAEGGVKGGTLPALVERLTLHDYLDMNFVNTFLLTYRSFCTSVELLDLLEARYNLECPDGLSEDERDIWAEKKVKLVRLRVFNVLKNWLDLYFHEDDSLLLDRLYNFTQTHIKKTLTFSNGQLESLIERRRNPEKYEENINGGLKRMILTLPDPPEPILPKNMRRIRLLEVDPLEMARQLTIMDFTLYSAIRPIECLDKSWSKDEEGNVAINIRASIDYCNQITTWVSDVILSHHDIKKRSVLIKYWVQVAEKCRCLNNFNTCMAILSAFDNSSVGRLKRTWEIVGARTNQTLQQIRKLMGANRNFIEYRALIHSINPPCIPFLGIYLQDLTFIEDGNSNVLKQSKNLINFAKRAKTAEVIREIQQYQSSLYQLKPVKELQEYIRNNLISTRDEEQLYKESLRLEPREREDEKITRLLQESGFL